MKIGYQNLSRFPEAISNHFGSTLSDYPQMHLYLSIAPHLRLWITARQG
ncbi:hypothetical protein [Dyadobacter helix]|nr:hypothetical protein [Dyadobacter sp. CECT 9275]